MYRYIFKIYYFLDVYMISVNLKKQTLIASYKSKKISYLSIMFTNVKRYKI